MGGLEQPHRHPADLGSVTLHRLAPERVRHQLCTEAETEDRHRGVDGVLDQLQLRVSGREAQVGVGGLQPAHHDHGGERPDIVGEGVAVAHDPHPRVDADGRQRGAQRPGDLVVIVLDDEGRARHCVPEPEEMVRRVRSSGAT